MIDINKMLKDAFYYLLLNLYMIFIIFGNCGYTSISKHSQILEHNEQEYAGALSPIDGPPSDDIGQQQQSLHRNPISGPPSPNYSTSAQIQNSNISPLVYTIYGYRHSTVRNIFFHMFGILLLGIPYLILNWFPSQFIYFKYRKCDLKECDVVFVINNRGQSSVEQVIILDFTDYDDVPDESIHETDHNRKGSINIVINNQIRLFIYEHVRYVLNIDTEQFIRLRNLDEISTVNEIMHVKNNGVSATKRDALLQLHGQNVIEVAVKSYWELFRSEIINPFYLFQIFSITLWCLDEYYYYGGCVFFLSGVSIFSSLYETRKQSLTLHMLIESLKSDLIQIIQPTPSEQCEKTSELTPLTTTTCTSSSTTIDSINPDYLVPGDIVVLPMDGCIMACDAVLISGSCIVNESMLTGESVPVTKTPPNPSAHTFEWASQKRHILYAGTTILQTRYYGNEKVLAKVMRTGFNTSKGELIKSILYPQPIGFQFYEDSVRFVTALFCVAAIGMAYCVRLYLLRNVEIETVLLRTLDIITIVIPPALPLAMTAGTVYSQSRLKQKNIFCISPQRINVCGKLKLVCFDKTGTLTEDGLTMYGCVECRDGQFVDVHPQEPKTFNIYTSLVQTLATCHSLTTINGTLNGDPLDIEMFRSINWDLIEPGQEHTRFDNLAPTIVKPKTEDDNGSTSPDSTIDIPYMIGIIKQHPFSSEAQCMSVIVRIMGHNNMNVFAKGAPEKIQSMCRPESVPANFYPLLHKYTSCGYRVIAMANKELSSKVKWRDVERMKRNEVEKDLTFVGFLILLNSLKPETTQVIEDLHAANMRTVMITGDNIMTALSVAKECKIVQPDDQIYMIRPVEDAVSVDPNGIIRPQLTIELCRDTVASLDEDDSINGTVISNADQSEVAINLLSTASDNKYHFALDGHTWHIIQTYYADFIPNIVARGTIFARFRPEQKSQIVLCLQQFDYIVAMCGDGANDCGALKAAHIGISLSQAEASVAAPFTSKDQNITCVKYLALEGRCALVTSFGLFKYMTLYSLIQFCTILILYSQCSILGNFQFLYIDLIITAGLAFTMGRQGPATKLVPKRPTSSLMSLANVIPLLLQVATCAAVQVAGLLYLYNQDWYISSIIFDESAKCNFNNLSFTALRAQSSELSRIDLIERTMCWENTVLFLISCFQYLVLGVVYSKGPPYRKPLYTNWLLVSIVTILTITTLIMLVRPPDILSDIFEIERFSYDRINENLFRLVILSFPIIHLVLSVMIESLMVDRRWFKKFIHFVTRKKVPKNKFKQIEQEISRSNKNWIDILHNSHTAAISYNYVA